MIKTRKHKAQLALALCILNWNLSVSCHKYLLLTCAGIVKVKAVFVSRQEYKPAKRCHSQQTARDV